RHHHSTYKYPEVTVRICPAPCEATCTLNIDENPVTIKSTERAIADRAIAQGLKPEPPAERTGKRVAVVDDRHPFTGAFRRRLGLEPLRDRAIGDRAFGRFDRDRVLVNVERACGFARRRADSDGHFRVFIGRVVMA